MASIRTISLNSLTDCEPRRLTLSRGIIPTARSTIAHLDWLEAAMFKQFNHIAIVQDLRLLSASRRQHNVPMLKEHQSFCYFHTFTSF
jgi:hypothetical protein